MLYTPVTDEAAEVIVRHAWDLGVRYFDVAPLYGSGAAEMRLGHVLRNYPRDAFTLSTKVGRLIEPDGTPIFDYSHEGSSDRSRRAWSGSGWTGSTSSSSTTRTITRIRRSPGPTRPRPTSALRALSRRSGPG